MKILRNGARQPWLRGKAAEAYSCDAKISPIVTGHLDPEILTRMTTILIQGTSGSPDRNAGSALAPGFHHLVVIHRHGWQLTLHADGTTTATSPDGNKTLHSHSPPPGHNALWTTPPGHNPSATAA